MNLEISCIYFIQSGITNLFKIGYTRNLKTRLAELHVGNPEILTVRGFIKVSYDILLKEEKIVQDYFKEHLSRAEWYIFESFEIVEKYIKRKNGELLTESFVDKSRTEIVTLEGIVSVNDLRPRCYFFRDQVATIMGPAGPNEKYRYTLFNGKRVPVSDKFRHITNGLDYYNFEAFEFYEKYKEKEKYKGILEKV